MENVAEKFDERDWRKALKAYGIPGPWDGEPDREEWRHAGLPCIVARGPLGAWCGYVGVPPGHPAYLKRADSVEAQAHGGLNYAETCQGPVCHIPQKGESHHTWWLGFDTGHFGDLIPGMVATSEQMRRRFPAEASLWGRTLERGEVYRDLSYVKDEVNRLADQLSEMWLSKPFRPLATAWGLFAGIVVAHTQHTRWWQEVRRLRRRFTFWRLNRMMRRHTDRVRAQERASEARH